MDLVFNGMLLDSDLVNQKVDDANSEAAAVARHCIDRFGEANKNYQKLAGFKALMQIRSNISRFRQQRLAAVDSE